MSGVSLVVMLVALIWHFGAHDPEDRLVAACFVVAAALTTLSLVRLTTRLAAGPQGLVVRELFRTRRIEWSEVRSLGNPTRGRFGVSNPTLEIDLDDDSLYVFGRFDLHAQPSEVRRELARQQAAGRRGY
jgi:hypothetical protein